MEESRRRFLKTSGVVVGTGILGASAGCTGILGGGGGGGSGLSANADWYYEPGAIQDIDHYSVSFQSNTQTHKNEDEFDSDTYDFLEENFESSYEFLGLDFDEVDSQIQIGSLVSLLSGYQVPREDIVDELEDNDYEDDDEYEGVQVFLGPNEARAVGITNNQIVVAESTWSLDDEAIDVLETAIDTSNGEEARYVDESEDFAEVLNQLKSGAFASARTQEETEETDEENGQFEGRVATGSSASINGETMNYRWVVTFGDSDDVDVDDIEDYTETDSFDDVDDISVSRSGRSGIITGTVDTDDY